MGNAIARVHRYDSDKRTDGETPFVPSDDSSTSSQSDICSHDEEGLDLYVRRKNVRSLHLKQRKHCRHPEGLKCDGDAIGDSKTTQDFAAKTKQQQTRRVVSGPLIKSLMNHETIRTPASSASLQGTEHQQRTLATNRGLCLDPLLLESVTQSYTETAEFQKAKARFKSMETAFEVRRAAREAFLNSTIDPTFSSLSSNLRAYTTKNAKQLDDTTISPEEEELFGATDSRTVVFSTEVALFDSCTSSSSPLPSDEDNDEVRKSKFDSQTKKKRHRKTTLKSRRRQNAIESYWRLGSDKWRECIDMGHAVRGRFVYDLCLHGGNSKRKEVGYLSSIYDGWIMASGNCGFMDTAQSWQRAHFHCMQHPGNDFFNGRFRNQLQANRANVSKRFMSNMVLEDIYEPRIHDAAIEEFAAMPERLCFIRPLDPETQDHSHHRDMPRLPRKTHRTYMQRYYSDFYEAVGFSFDREVAGKPVKVIRHFRGEGSEDVTEEFFARRGRRGATQEDESPLVAYHRDETNEWLEVVWRVKGTWAQWPVDRDVVLAAAATLHQRLSRMEPSRDGNTRAAVVLINKLLCDLGLSPGIFRWPDGAALLSHPQWITETERALDRWIEAVNVYEKITRTMRETTSGAAPAKTFGRFGGTDCYEAWAWTDPETLRAPMTGRAPEGKALTEAEQQMIAGIQERQTLRRPLIPYPLSSEFIDRVAPAANFTCPVEADPRQKNAYFLK